MKVAPLGREATLEDLYRVEGRAELVDGQIVLMAPTGFRPGEAAARIRRRLDTYKLENGGGHAISEGVGFLIQIPELRTVSPDVA